MWTWLEQFSVKKPFEPLESSPPCGAPGEKNDALHALDDRSVHPTDRPHSPVQYKSQLAGFRRAPVQIKGIERGGLFPLCGMVICTDPRALPLHTRVPCPHHTRVDKLPLCAPLHLPLAHASAPWRRCLRAHCHPRRSLFEGTRAEGGQLRDPAAPCECSRTGGSGVSGPGWGISG